MIYLYKNLQGHTERRRVMNDTLREYLSYGKLIIPMIKTRREITPEKVQWGDREQYFSIFRAPHRKYNTLVIYINGGGWQSNSPENHYFIGQKIAQNGSNCVMFSYRKAPRHTYDEMTDDIFRNYSELKSYLKKSGASYPRTVIMGASAGAHLASILCFDRNKKEKYGITDTEIVGLISMAGPLCFDPPMTNAIRSLLTTLFRSKDPQQWKKGEPYSMLYSIPSLDIHLIQSRPDGLIGYEQAEKTAAKASELGMNTNIYEVTDSWDTHSAYCVGSFMLDRQKSGTLDKTLSLIESFG